MEVKAAFVKTVDDARIKIYMRVMMHIIKASRIFSIAYMFTLWVENINDLYKEQSQKSGLSYFKVRLSLDIFRNVSFVLRTPLHCT